MKGCNVFLVHFMLLVLSVCIEGRSAAQNTCNIFRELPCDDGLQCINRKNWCDGDYNCDDGSDEEFCTESRWFFSSCNTEKHFECASGKCIPLVARCDDFDDCGDLSDENNCEQETTEGETYATVTPYEYPTISKAPRILTSTSNVPTTMRLFYPTTSKAPRILTSTSNVPTTMRFFYPTTSKAPRILTSTTGIPTTVRAEYPTTSKAPRILTSTSSMFNPITKEYYSKRSGDSNTEDKKGYHPPHYYERSVNNERTYHLYLNSYSTYDQLPHNYNYGQSYPYPENQDRNSDGDGIHHHQNQYVTDALYPRSIGLRPAYDPYRRYQTSHVDRQHHLVIPPRTVRHQILNVKCEPQCIFNFYF